MRTRPPGQWVFPDFRDREESCRLARRCHERSAYLEIGFSPFTQELNVFLECLVFLRCQLFNGLRAGSKAQGCLFKLYVTRPRESRKNKELLSRYMNELGDFSNRSRRRFIVLVVFNTYKLGKVNV